MQFPCVPGQTILRIPRKAKSMRKPDSQTLFLGTVIAGSIVLLGYLAMFYGNGEASSRPAYRSTLHLVEIPFNGQRAYQFLQDISDLGPRPSGSEGMAQQQKMLAEHFERLGGRVNRQQFRARHPEDGSAVVMANLLVEWHPQRTERVLLCAHYDTRPFPDRDPDPRRRKGIFVGANDGASGVAVLTEMAYHMRDLDSKYGVDFVLFDGEEFVFDDRRDKYFLGSEFFARNYVAQPPAYRYRWGVLLDMVGDADLQLFQEKHSKRWSDTRPLVVDIWNTANRLGVTEFIVRPRHKVRDDHLMLHDIGKIPTCDIIDFDYPRPGAKISYWHTEADTADKCSALSLAKVGWVVHVWLQELK